MRGRILVVDDEKNQRELIAGFLEKKGHDVQTADGGERAIRLLEEGAFDLVLTDYKMKDINGVELLSAVKAINPITGVILMSAYGTVETAVEAMKIGAEDFLVKPINLTQLEELIKRALDKGALIRENRQLKKRLEERYRFDGVIGESGPIQQALNLAGRAANSKATILIRGESGTGKGMIANAIHQAGDRANGPFLEINCAALSPGVLESELFGHEKGSFTGADRRREGLFESAHGGTLFIDEVGDIPKEVQVKLLNVLQSGSFTRVGGSHPLQVDVRIVAATHRDLEEAIRQGDFREDLYFRLNVVSIVLPPLRDRKSDIPTLVDHFIHRYAAKNQKLIQGVTAEAMECLMRYSYPGNIRELENAIERAVVLARQDVIETDDLPSSIRLCGKTAPSSGPIAPGTTPLPEMIEALERKAIGEALEMSGGIQTKAAAILGITERNLRYKIEKYGLKSKD